MVLSISHKTWLLSWSCVVLLCATYSLADPLVVTKYVIPYSWADLTWSDSKTAFIVSSDATVWRSADEGQTWSQMRFQNGNRSFSVARVYQNSYNPSTIIFLMQRMPGDVTGYAFLTTNGAATNPHFLVLPMHVSDIKWHPRIPNAFSANDRNDWGYILAVQVSYDLGNTWISVFNSVELAGQSWGGSTDTASVNTLYFWDSDNSNFGYRYGDQNLTQSQNILEDIFGYIFLDPYLYIGQKRRSDGKGTLMVAQSPAAFTSSGSYREAMFPFGDELPNLAYTIFEANTGAARVGISHSLDSGNSWGNVYTSDEKGWMFTATLEHVNQPAGLFDFDEIYGVKGAYIANIVTDPQSSDSPVRTVFTLNSGATWQPLKAPAVDYNGVPINCDVSSGCSLHLNGISGYVFKGAAPFYSSPNAVGLVIATGNTGTALNADIFNTYFSRDGGITWSELVPGAYIYEIGDHGGIVVMAKSRGVATNIITYSLDEGNTWTNFQLDSYVVVDNILVEPSATSNKFVLFGTQVSPATDVVMGLDFSGLHERNCTDADYVDWISPYIRSDGQQCVLGVKTTYSRRNQTAACFNQRDKEIVKEVTPCVCTLNDDFECDYGYVRDQTVTNSLTCAKQLSFSDPPANCVEGQPYYVPGVYRRIVGDGCTQPSTPVSADEGTTKICPGPSVPESPSSTAAEWAIAVFLILLAVALAGGFFYLYRNDQARAKLLSMVGGKSDSARYSRLGGVRPQSFADEEFGADTGLDDDDEPDAPVLQDHDIKASLQNP